MEDLLAGELRALGAENVKSSIAGVYFAGDLTTAYRVCLWSRLANRVLLPIASFKAAGEIELYREINKIDWFEHLNPDSSFAVTFNAKNSDAINNTHYGALKVKDTVVDAMRTRYGRRPDIDTSRPDVRLNVLLNGESCSVSLDLAGESLHRRGYRDQTIKAPIKENLAAALLIRAGWPNIAKLGGTLIDPMCGSGTLLVEAALMASDYAPGLLRDYFGFVGWKKHDAAAWDTLIRDARQRKQAGLSGLPAIIGFDADRRNLGAAHLHIENAGLTGKIHLECRDIGKAAPAASWRPGLMICNPPYGERLGDEQVTAELYTRFGETLKTQFLGWQAAVIISNPELGFRLGIRSQKPATFFNGALECKLLRMKIEDRAFFIPKAKTEEERIAQVESVLADKTAQAIPVGMEKIQRDNSDETHPTAWFDGLSQDEAGSPQDREAPDFANRLQKNLKKLQPWRVKNRITCYRLYDADLPEYAVAVDVYYGSDASINGTWVNVQEYEPPKQIDPHKANRRLAALLAEIPKVLSIPSSHIFFKIRKKQKNTEQYQKFGDHGRFYIVEEHGCKLRVNFSDYLDTGLFLDHRPMRLAIQRQAQGKRFLNLFAYTGSATVHAAVGGAAKTTTVDMSQTYLDWAKSNLALNTVNGEHEFIRADCLDWLKQESEQPYPRQYDIIFLDPPTFSNSKRMDAAFDIQNDHVELLKQAVKLLATDGVLYFSTNFRRFKLANEALAELKIENITASTIPEDFKRNPKIHYCWRIHR